MTVYLLVAMFFLNGQPQLGTGMFASKESCNAAITVVVSDLVKQNIDDASVTCTSFTVGKLS